MNNSYIMSLKAQLLFFIMAIFVSYAFSQADVASEIKRSVAEIKKGQNVSLDERFFIQENAQAIVTQAGSYVFDNSADVRKAMYKYIHRASFAISEAETRQKAVFILSRACLDSDSRACVLAAKFLTDFKAADFSEDAIIHLSSAFEKRKENLAEVILLIGFLQIKKYEQDLLSYAIIGVDNKIKWNALIALARMGNAQGIEMCVGEFKSYPLNDDLLLYKIPGMLYTHRKECYAPVIEILYVEQELCDNFDPTTQQSVLCAYRVMEYLAPYIQDYPLQIKSSGSVKASNYDEALDDVRLWFKKKKDKYVIVDDLF